MFATFALAVLAVPVPQGDPTAGVDGRFLLPSGEVAEGASWRIHGWGANTDRKLEFGEPEDWEDPTGWLGDDGRLRARFDSPQAYQFTLTVSLEGYVSASYRWSRIEPKQVIDVGDVTLRPAGKVAGTIVDGNGEALTGRRWVVYATEIGARTSKGRDATFLHGTADPESARYEIDGLPGGPVELEVMENERGGNRNALKTRVQILAGQTLARDLVIEAPDKDADKDADKVVVRFSMARPYHSAPAPLSRHVWLVAGDGTRRQASGDERWTRSWTFDDVGEGPFRVEIDDPGFDPFSKDGVRRGDRVVARLGGSAAIRLDVRDASGEALQLYQADITFRNANFGPDTFRPADGRTPLQGGLLDHLVPFDYGITVRSGELTGYALVDALAAGETRAVRVDLRPVTVVRGVVRYPDGTPAGALIRLVTPAEEGDSPESRILPKNARSSAARQMRKEVARARTGDTGEFSFTIEVPGTYLVVAGGEGAPRAEYEAFDTTAGGAPTGIVIELDRGGVIDGRVDFPEGLVPDGRRVWYRLQDPVPQSLHFVVPMELDDEGRFRLGPLAPGQYEFFVDRRPPSGDFWSSASGLSLGMVDVVDGEVHEPTLEFPGGPPVAVTFDLTPTEVDGDAVRLVAREGNGDSPAPFTGKAPRVGPIALEPWTYDVWFEGDGWLARLEGFDVARGEKRTEVLDLDLWSRRVRLVHGGAPLANAEVRFDDAPKELRRVHRTDAEGWVELRLGAATYALSAPIGEPWERKLATIEWPLGEGVEDIVFR